MKKADSEKKIIIAGFGGQGVILAGTVLGNACIFEGKNVTAMASYGAEVRGGTANATVVISDGPIASPVVETADIGIILNQPSLDKFESQIVPNGIVVLNSSLIERLPQRKDLTVFRIDATRIADELGDTRVANIVTLGAFVKKTAILSAESVERAVEKVLAGKKNMVEINKAALRKGLELAY